MNNRELTYYSLANRAEMRRIEELADNTPQETFIALGFEKKHFHHLWIGANNEAFISTVSFITDLKKLNTKLTTQLKRYNEKDNLNINSTKDWLKHTKFIFQDEYNKTQKEIFLEVIEWCKEQLIVDSDTPKNIGAKQQNEPDIIFNKSDPSSHLFYDFYKNIGWVDKIEKNTGLIINPTHSFELLKKKRLGLFEQEKENFIKERKVKGIDTSSKEMDTLYKVWLSSELKTMDDNFSTNEETISNQIEINKYRQFVKDEIQNITQYYNVEKINTGYVNKYLEIYEAMFQEHLKVFDSNQEPNQVTINLLLNQDHEYHKGFTNEWQDKLLDLIEKKQDIHPYLRKIYVNGFMKIKCDAKRYDNKMNTIPINKAHIGFLNFIHGVGLICQNIREYLQLNYKLKVSEITPDDYNISGNYFGEFKTFSIESNNSLPMKKEQDISYYLLDFEKNRIQNTSDYKTFKSTIEHHGFFLVNKAKIYTPEMAYILTKKEIRGKTLSNKNNKIVKIKTIKTYDYLTSYLSGYNNGIEFFKKNFAVSPNILYGENAFAYVDDLHENYVHIQHHNMEEGWKFIKEQCPFIINRKIINQYGYYSGIVNEVDQLRKKYPVPFTDFEKCNVKEKEDSKELLEEPKQAQKKVKSKNEKLLEALSNYEFSKLPKLEEIQGKQYNLIELLCKNDIPYQIAMLDHLGFFEHLQDKHTKTKEQFYKLVSEILSTSKRGIKGNYLVLNPNSKEDRTRYTADTHTKQVKKDFNKLK